MHFFERNTALTAFYDLHVVVKTLFSTKTSCCSVNGMIEAYTA